MFIEDWIEEEKFGPLTKYILFFVVCIVFYGGIYFGIRLLNSSTTTEYERENSVFHSLPAVPQILAEPEEKIAVGGGNAYAQEGMLALTQYTEYDYSGDLLTAEADYDKDGRLTGRRLWAYDTAGNVIEERIKSGTDEQTRSCLYEYDDAGNVVHQKVFWDGALAEDHYFRDTAIGRAGVSYSYFDEQVDGGISAYCTEQTEYLEDEEGRLQCMFRLKGMQTERPYDACKLQWAKRGQYLVSRLRYYGDTIWVSSRADWYQTKQAASREQCNLYMRDAGTQSRNCVLEITYTRDEEEHAYQLVPSFYRARYDGDSLLWQMTYTEGALTGFSVCAYDADGRIRSGVEYGMEEEPYALFHQFVYPQEDRAQKYSYEIRAKEFAQPFGDGESAAFTFSQSGVLIGIKMTDVSENVTEEFTFEEAGEDMGRLKNETAYLQELEAEAMIYGFQVGKNLEGSTE